MRRSVAVLLLAAGLGGCTAAEEDSDKEFRGAEAQVAKAIEDLQDAGEQRDETAICEDLISADLRNRILRSGAKDCPSAMEDVLSDADTFALDVEDVTVEGDTATARVKSDGAQDDRTDTLRLVRERGAWRIAALGG